MPAYNPSGLNTRQRLLFAHRVSIYRKSREATTGDWVWASVLTGLYCYLFTSENYDKTREGVGLIRQENIFTADVMKCEYSVDLRDTDVIYVTEPTTPPSGSCFMVQGNPKGRVATARRRPNFLQVYLIPTDAPPGVPS